MVATERAALRLGRGHDATLVTGQLFAVQVAVIATSLAVSVLSARALGPAGRGHLALLLQVAYAGVTFSLVGADRTYPATVKPPNPSPRRAIRDLTRLTALPTLIAATVLVPVGLVLRSAIAGSVAIGVIAAGLTASYVLRTASTASGTGRLYLYPAVTCQLALVAMAVVLSVDGTGSVTWWLWAYALSQLAAPVVAWLLLRNYRRTARSSLRLPRRAGLRVMPATIASAIMMRSDRLLLPLLSTLTQAGWYAVASTLTEAITYPVAAYADSHITKWREAAKAGELHTLKILTAAAAYGLSAAVASVAVGRVVIVPVFGAAFAPALPLLPPLAAAAAIYSVSRVAISLDAASGRLRTAMVTDLPAVVVAVGAYVLLIPHLGAMGAAWGSLAGYSTATAVSVVLALRQPTPTTLEAYR